MGELQSDGTADVGALLVNMALDAPPPVTRPDEVPPAPAQCPLDAIYAALVAAANLSDVWLTAEAQKLHDQRQNLYRDAINGAT